MDSSVWSIVMLCLIAWCVGLVAGMALRDIQRERAERRAGWARLGGGWPPMPMPFPPHPQPPPRPEPAENPGRGFHS